MADVEALVAAAREHDVVSPRSCRRSVLERLARAPARLVADLYNPIVVEVLAGVAARPPAARSAGSTGGSSRARSRCCAAADLVLCANERQRDLWIGGMALHGLLDPDAYARDPTLRSLVDVVPFGLPDGPAAGAGGRAARRVPRDRRRDRVLVWGGGVWGWLDPVTPIAGGRAARRRPPRPARRRPARAGGDRPGGGGRGGGRGGAAARGCSAPACTSTRAGCPTRSAARGSPRPTSASAPTATTLEARYAHRTRLLDYLWAGLPVVTTSRRRAGRRSSSATGSAPRSRPATSAGVRGGLRARCSSRGDAAARERIAAVAPSLRWERGRRAARRLVRARRRPRRPVPRGAVRRAGARPVPLGARRDARRRAGRRAAAAARPAGACAGGVR